MLTNLQVLLSELQSGRQRRTRVKAVYGDHKVHGCRIEGVGGMKKNEKASSTKNFRIIRDFGTHADARPLKSDLISNFGKQYFTYDTSWDSAFIFLR